MIEHYIGWLLRKGYVISFGSTEETVAFMVIKKGARVTRWLSERIELKWNS